MGRWGTGRERESEHELTSVDRVLVVSPSHPRPAQCASSNSRTPSIHAEHQREVPPREEYGRAKTWNDLIGLHNYYKQSEKVKWVSECRDSFRTSYVLCTLFSLVLFVVPADGTNTQDIYLSFVTTTLCTQRERESLCITTHSGVSCANTCCAREIEGDGYAPEVLDAQTAHQTLLVDTD